MLSYASSDKPTGSETEGLNPAIAMRLVMNLRSVYNSNVVNQNSGGRDYHGQMQNHLLHFLKLQTERKVEEKFRAVIAQAAERILRIAEPSVIK